MEPLILALGPAFAVGLAIQQLLELADIFLVKMNKEAKSILTSVVALLLGLGLAYFGGFQVLGPLGIAVPRLVEVVVTGLIISGGTEGINSLVKFLGYAKEKQKEEVKEGVAALATTDEAKNRAREEVDAMHL